VMTGSCEPLLAAHNGPDSAADTRNRGGHGSDIGVILVECTTIFRTVRKVRHTCPNPTKWTELRRALAVTSAKGVSVGVLNQPPGLQQGPRLDLGIIW
jgi:hypothetical protein